MIIFEISCFQYLIFSFMPNEVNIRNKRASFDYEFLEEYNAGIVPYRYPKLNLSGPGSQSGRFPTAF